MLHIVKRMGYGIVVSLIIVGLPRTGLAGTITMFLTDFDVTYLGSAPVGGAFSTRFP